MAAPTSESYWALLARNSDFRRLYIARLVSFAGDWFLIVPLLGLVLDETNSPLATASVFAANSFPAFLATPFAGTIADRFSRRLVMIGSKLVGAAAVTAILLVDGGLIWILGMVSVISTAAAFFNAASSAAIPALVPSAGLAPANVLINSTWGTMAAVGAAAGGALSTLTSRETAFVVDAVSFLVAAGVVATIDQVLRPDSAGERPSFISALSTVARYARARPQVAALLSAKSGFAIVASGTIALFPAISAELYDLSDDGTGILFGARGVGALVGPFLFERLLRRDPRRILSAIGPSVSLWGVAYIGLAVSPVIALAAFAVAIAHSGGGSQYSFSSYGLQMVSDDWIRGRIFAVDHGMFMLAMTVSTLTVGWLATFVPLRPLIAVTAAVAALFGLIWRHLTRHLWEHLPATTA